MKEDKELDEEGMLNNFITCRPTLGIDEVILCLTVTTKESLAAPANK